MSHIHQSSLRFSLTNKGILRPKQLASNILYVSAYTGIKNWQQSSRETGADLYILARI